MTSLDAELFDFGLERVPRNSEPRGPTHWTRDTALVAFAERLLDHCLFTLEKIGDELSLPDGLFGASKPGRIDL